MNMNKTVLRTAIATALGFASPYLMANVFEIGNPVKLSTELKVNDGDEVVFATGSGFKMDISAAAGRTVSDTSPMEVRFTLTNGAKFSSVTMAKFACDFKSPHGETGAVSMLNGAAGDTTVTFKLRDGIISASTPTCALSGVNVKLYGGQQAYTIMASAYLKSNADPIIINTSAPLIDFNQAYGAGISQKTVTIDVTNPSLSQKFVGSQTIADLGSLSYTAVSTTTTYKIAAAGVTAIGKSDVMSTLKATLSGTPLSVDGKVIAVSGNYAGGCTANFAATPPMLTAAASGVTFSIGATTASLGAVTFCLQTSGTVRLEKGKITLGLDSTSPSGSTPNVTLTSPTLTNVIKNGASIKILNIPNSTTTTDKALIRVYNMSSAKASVYGTLYETGGGTAAGKVIGSGKLLAEIDAGSVAVLDSAGLEKIFGASWTGRAWMQIEGDTQQIRAQSLVRSGGVGGTLINLSDRILEDGGKLCRSDTQCK